MATKPLHLVLYTRIGCHLCDDAHRLLLDQRGEYPFTLELIDIDGDPSLAKQFGECVPVVAIQGKVRFRGRIQTALLKRILDNEHDRSSSPSR